MTSKMLEAQEMDTLKLDTFDFVDKTSFNSNVSKLLFYGYRITGDITYNSYIAIKDYKTGSEKILPTYMMKDYIGYESAIGDIIGWIDDDHVLIREAKMVNDEIPVWVSFNVQTMKGKEIIFDHQIGLNDNIFVDHGSIVYNMRSNDGKYRVYHYDYYTEKTTLYHIFEDRGNVNVTAYSKKDNRLFFFSAYSSCLNYLENNLVHTIPLIFYGKDSINSKVSNFDFRYEPYRHQLYFLTKKSRVSSSSKYLTEPQLYLVQCYDMQNNSLVTLDTFDISGENYFYIKGFELFVENTLLISIEKRSEKNIQGPQVDLDIGGINMALFPSLSTEKHVLKLSLEQ